MKRTSLLLGGLAAALLLLPTSPTVAAPKSGPNGESCIETGTTRRTGEDKASGKKYDCQWDYCKYCDQSSGQINCSIQKTSYENPTDCKEVAARPGGATVGPQTVNPGVLDPGTTSPPTGRGPTFRPGGTLQRN